MTMTAHDMIDIWDSEHDRINQLEDKLNAALDRMIEQRPAEFKKRFTEEDFKTATKIYIGFIETVGAIRGALREIRSIKKRFPGQITDPESASALLYSTTEYVTTEIHKFVDLYTKHR